MKVSVIIVTHNQHDVLRTCIKSALVAMEGMDGEVIVVDNASTDATPDMLAAEFPGVRSIRNPVNLYYTRAVNQGMRAAAGEYVYLLNDDTELEPGGIKTLVEFMQSHPRCGALGPQMRSPEHDLQASAHKFPTPLREALMVLGVAHLLRNKPWSRTIQKEYPLPLATGRVDWVCGGAIMLPRRLMETLGHHDEHYLFYRDDPDIGVRLRRAGYEVWYCAETYVLHHHGKSTVKTPRKLRFGIIDIRSRRHYHRKHHGMLPSFALECVYGFGYLARALRRLALGRVADAKKQWTSFLLLFEAISMPEEERAAYDGYRRCAYNGLGEGGDHGPDDGGSRPPASKHVAQEAQA